jgi:hypothetical protein
MTDETFSESQGNENSEEPDSNKSGNKIEYTKADLLWELTRRNQNYIDSFNTVKKIYLQLWSNLGGVKNHIMKGLEKTFDLDAIPTTEQENISENSIRYPGTPNEWKIMMKAAVPISKQIGFNFSDFKSYTWLDPKVTIAEIKNELNNPGADPLAIHPYYALFNLISPEDLFYHYAYFEDPSLNLRPGEKKLITFSSDKNIGMFYERDIDSEVYICISKKSLGKRVLFMFDPYSNEEDIKSTVIKVRRNVQPVLEKKIKENREITYESSGVKTYLGWIKTYDNIISAYEKKIKKPNFINNNGAKILPEKLPKGAKFADLVAAVASARKEKNSTSYYKIIREQYLKAIKLIQITPDIIFSSGRDQDRKKRGSSD